MQAIADGFPVRISKKKEEKIPLKFADGGIYRPWYAPHGGAFNIIILCMVIFSIAVTVALIVQIAYTDQTVYYGGSVVTENYQCGSIGHDVLQEGGSAVDAAIAVQFCLGVTMPHLTGIGGGGFMIIYKNGVNPEKVSINFREAVPAQFKSRTPDPTKNNNAERIGVPGTLRGLGLAHKMYGKLSWERLLRPSVQLAVEGFVVGFSLFQSIHQVDLSSPYLRELFIPNGSSVFLNERVTSLVLGNTLNTISNEGADALYNGSLTEKVVHDVQSFGGVISVEDLNNYQAVQEPPVEISIGDMQILASTYPSSGPSLVYAMQLLNASIVAKSNDSFTWFSSLLQALENAGNHHQNLSATQFAKTLFSNVEHNGDNVAIRKKLEMFDQFYMRRTPPTVSFLQDGSALPGMSDGATVVALDSDELFVAMVSGLGSRFGSQIVTSSGIILNDALLNVDTVIEGDRPRSAMVAELVVEENRPCGVRLAAASSDYQMLVQADLQLLTGLTSQDAFMRSRLILTTDGTKIVTVNENNSDLNAQVLDRLKEAGYVIVKGNHSSPSIGVVGKHGKSTWSFTDAKPEGFNDNF